MERNVRARPQQFLCLIRFMEKFGDLGKYGPGPESRRKSELLWERFSNMVNGLPGGVKKSTEKWKKVWADWKANTKKKALVIRFRNRCNTENQDTKVVLTPLEHRLVALMGISLKEANHEVVVPKEETDPLTLPKSSAVTENHLSDPDSQESHFLSEPEIPDTSPHADPEPTPIRLSQKLRMRRKIRTDVYSEFAAVEMRRLRFEQLRETMMHEREMQRMKLESEKFQVERERNQVLQNLARIGENLVNVLTARQ